MQGDEVFAQFLLDAGVLPRGVLVRALEQTSQDHPLGDVLVEQGLLSEEDATRALAKALSVPAVVLHHDDIEHEALFAIPEAFSRMHGVVGYKKDHQTLWVAAASLAGAEQIKTLYLPYQVRVHLTDKQSLKRALLRYQRELAERYARQLSSGAAPDIAVDSLLLHALAQGARAVHLTPQDGLLSVGYRIGDALHCAMQLPENLREGIFARVGQLAGVQGRFAIQHQNNKVVVHVTPGTSYAGDTLTLHFSGVSLEGTGLHGEGLEAVHRALLARSGLLLVAGDGTAAHLCTVLSREAAHTSRLVMQVTESETVSAATRLRGVLRADPDIVVIPQLDAETLLLAVHAANRGVLVVGGFEAASATDALMSLCEHVPPALLSAVLLGVVAVRTVGKLCSAHERVRLSREEIDELEARGVRLPIVLTALKQEDHLPPAAQWKDVPFYAPKPCPECDRGFSGETILTEVVPRSMLLVDMLRRGESADDIEAYLRSEGILSMLEDGVFKAALGETTVEEVLGALV